MKPPKISVYIVLTHCRPEGLNRRPRWIDGSATFTIVASTTTMNCATHTITITSHGLPVPVAPTLRPLAELPVRFLLIARSADSTVSYSPVKRYSACQGPSEWTTSQ
jgi:hypothetical protein